MDDEVRGLLEEALAGCLRGVVACAVVTGDEEGTRPDEYVAVVAAAAENRAIGVYLIDLEVRVVVPADDSVAVANAKLRLRAICDYLDDLACPFRTYEAGGVHVFGYRLMQLDNKRGMRSKADIITLKIGARATT